MYKFTVFPGNHSSIVRKAVEARGNWVQASEQEAADCRVQFIWKPTSMPILSYLKLDEAYANTGVAVVHNHLDKHREITTKPGLVRSLRAFYQSHKPALLSNYHLFDTIPTSFIITIQVEDTEYQNFLTRFSEIQVGKSSLERLPAKHCGENMWLVKPAALNQGKGIEVCHTLKEIKDVLRSKPPQTIWVVQKYVERPLLFHGRKFDIRVWALATAKKELFFYKQGYLRTSSFDYDTSVSDNYVHLTNNCLQKWGDHYGKHETGNTLSFEAFQHYLDEKFPDLNLDVNRHFIKRIKDLIIDSYLSAKKIIHKSKRRSAFELLGFDFLVDEDFRVWLIEVNTNPYLGIPNEFIADLLPKMIDDMLKIVLDPVYSPEIRTERAENDFELLYCEIGSAFSPDSGSKNIRQPYSTPIYPVPELAQAPMCRTDPYEIHRAVEEEASPPPQDMKTKPVVKDIITTLRDIMETSSDISDFFHVTNRIISKLKNWELHAEDSVSSAGQALKLLASTIGLHSLIAYNHLMTLLHFISSEDHPAVVQVSTIEAITLGFSDLKFRKELVKLGVVKGLVALALSSDRPSMLPIVVKALCTVTTHPLKRFYIPGETREHNWIRQQALQDGAMLCLYKIAEESTDEELVEMVNKHIVEEFSLPDWEMQASIIDRILDTSLSIHPRLQDTEWLVNHNSILKENIGRRKEEIKLKAEEDQRQKQEETIEKLKQREEEDKAYIEKKQRLEEQMLKRYEEMRRQKMAEAQKKAEEKHEVTKIDEQRRLALMEKIKYQEANKKAHQAKKKQLDEEQRKVEEELRQRQDQVRRKALENWQKAKLENDRKKRQIEKQKREEEEQRRQEEIEIRRQELQLKIEARKSKEPIPTRKSATIPGKSTNQQEIALIDMQDQTLASTKYEYKGDSAITKLEPVLAKVSLSPKAVPRKLKFKREEQPSTKFLFDIYGSASRDQRKRKSL
mmetsp:Transcript_13307/g.25002  ORF Transcript_13307/g.25002 Transcript_13307/m.25002 type:complete len:961 (+) Transcript_13307:506-3388(+)